MSISTQETLLDKERYRGILEWVNQAGPDQLEGLRTTLVAVQSVPDSLERTNAPRLLQGKIRRISEFGPEFQSDVIAKISAKIHELSVSTSRQSAQEAPQTGGGGASEESVTGNGRKRTLEPTADMTSEGIFEPLLKKPKPPLTQENATETSMKDLAGLPLQRVASFFDLQFQACVSGMNKAFQGAVHQEWADTFQRLFEQKGLQELLPFFVSKPPLPQMPTLQQHITWKILQGPDSELFKVVQTSLEMILKSPFLTSEEKDLFGGKSVREIVCDLELLHLLLQAEYDRNLVLFSTMITEVPPPDLSTSHTLSEKADVVRKFFHVHGASITEFLHTPGCEVTCIPKEICLLSNLRTLSLYVNSLRSLPESFGSLTNLEFLNLGGNDLKSLPESFGSLTKLSRLSLFCNHLRSLPDSFSSLTNLRYLSIACNGLKSLPEPFGPFPKLIHLSLEFNTLRSLPDFITSFSSLKSLEIDDLQYQSSRDAVESLKMSGVDIMMYQNEVTPL